MNYIKVDIKPLSILQLKKQNPELVYDQDWYNKEKFVLSKPKSQTIWVGMTEVANSRNKTWDEQVKLLSADEEVPTTNTLIQAMIQHYKVTRERLFSDCYVRTSDVDSVGRRVYVGRFGADGLGVGNDWDGYRGDSVGLASSRKSEPSDLKRLTLLPSLKLEAVIINGKRYRLEEDV